MTRSSLKKVEPEGRPTLKSLVLGTAFGVPLEVDHDCSIHGNHHQ